MAEERLKYFGWGRIGESLTPEEEASGLARYRSAFGVEEFEEKHPPALEEIEARAPRVTPPPSLTALCTTAIYDRAAHTYGKSFPDTVRGLAGDYANAPDVVAYPRDEADIAAAPLKP